jgi:hypothetical protein
VSEEDTKNIFIDFLNNIRTKEGHYDEPEEGATDEEKKGYWLTYNEIADDGGELANMPDIGQTIHVALLAALDEAYEKETNATKKAEKLEKDLAKEREEGVKAKAEAAGVRKDLEELKAKYEALLFQQGGKLGGG